MIYPKLLTAICILFFTSYTFANNEFKIFVNGTKEPVVASIDDLNYVTFISFPKKFFGGLKIKNASVGVFYPAGITKENCTQVEMRAKNAINTMFPDDLRSNQRKIVRNMNPVDIYLNSGINFALKSFQNKVIKEAARIKNIDESLIQIDNNFTIDKINYMIEYQNNAISNIIDNKNEFENQTIGFLAQNIFIFGDVSINTTYTDLVCDFYLKRAILKMKFIGSYGKLNSSYQLLENNEISLIYNNILTHNKDYFEISTINAKNRNMAISSLFLKESLIKFVSKNIDQNNFIYIFEKMIDMNTGKIIQNLSEENLYQLMQVQYSIPNQFNAEVIYEPLS